MNVAFAIGLLLACSISSYGFTPVSPKLFHSTIPYDGTVGSMELHNIIAVVLLFDCFLYSYRIHR